MPTLDWVNKAQAANSAADVPYHLLQLTSVHGEAGAASAALRVSAPDLAHGRPGSTAAMSRCGVQSA